jgi:hypothetical protein
MLDTRDISPADHLALLLDMGFVPVLATTDIGQGTGAMKRYNHLPVMVSAESRYIVFNQGIWMMAMKMELRHYKPPRAPVIIAMMAPA